MATTMTAEVYPAGTYFQDDRPFKSNSNDKPIARYTVGGDLQDDPDALLEMLERLHPGCVYVF